MTYVSKDHVNWKIDGAKRVGYAFWKACLLYTIAAWPVHLVWQMRKIFVSHVDMRTQNTNLDVLLAQAPIGAHMTVVVT